MPLIDSSPLTEKETNTHLVFGTVVKLKIPGKKAITGPLTRKPNSAIGLLDMSSASFWELVERVNRIGGVIGRQQLPFVPISIEELQYVSAVETKGRKSR